MKTKLPAEAKHLALGGMGDALVMMGDDEPLLIDLPDVLLLDLNMPGVSGVRSARRHAQ
jgi:CheY-like chemotaxis protein